MLIKTIDEMEQIVSKNKSLKWDGWTVVSLQPIKDGTFSKDAVKIKNRWFIQRRYELSSDGWEIPNKLVG